MQMKSWVEQGVYTLVILARIPKKTTISAECLSKCLGVSPSYLKKLMRKLVQAGLIHSVPGIKGGFSLAKNASDITVYDVYVAVEGVESLYRNQGIFEQIIGNEEVKDKVCVLEKLMCEAENSWKEVLKRETLSSLNLKMDNICLTQNLKLMNSLIKDEILKES